MDALNIKKMQSWSNLKEGPKAISEVNDRAANNIKIQYRKAK